MRIAIVYFSETGTTHTIAEAVAAGCTDNEADPAKSEKPAANNSAVEVELYRIVGGDIVEGRFKNDSCLKLIDAADAVVLGSPTFMGGPAAQFKAFADASSVRWDKQRWAGKIAAGFTVGANLNGDQLATLQYFTILAAQHGMIWMGLDLPGGYDSKGRNRLGTQSGVCACSADGNVDTVDIETARYLGTRIVALMQRMS